MSTINRLNPFEIRASVQHKVSKAIELLRDVSIPLKSGHRFNFCPPASPSRLRRLNPFEIRASVQPQARQQARHGQ